MICFSINGKLKYQIRDDKLPIGYLIFKRGFNSPDEYVSLREAVRKEWKRKGWDVTFLKTQENREPSNSYRYFLVLKVWKHFKPHYYCPHLVEIGHNLGLTRLCIVKGEYREEFIGPEAIFCRTGRWEECPIRRKYSS